MANGKRTRFALARSLLCAALCLALLVGTTFAWFSDEAKTGQTTITAGNLDVELQVEQEDGTFEEVTPDTKLFPEDVVWEPGMMRESGVFKVVNAGSLALQYELFLEIKPADGSEGPDLGKVIKLKVLSKEEYDKHSAELGEDATLQARRDLWNAIGGEGVTDYSKGKLLPAGKEADETDKGEGFTDDETPGLIVVLFWDPSDSAELDNPDNEYNAKDGAAALSAAFSLDVFATQVPYESDSFGKRYDNIYVAGNDRELRDAVEKAGEGDLIDVLPGTYDGDDFEKLQPGVDVQGTRDEDGNPETVIDVDQKGLVSSGGHVSDVKFEKVGGGGTTTALAELSEGAVIENCEFVDTRQSKNVKAVKVDGSATVRGCKFLSGNGIYNTGDGITGELLVEDCTFSSAVLFPLNIIGGDVNGHVTLRGCQFLDELAEIYIGNVQNYKNGSTRPWTYERDENGKLIPETELVIGGGVTMENCTVAGTQIRVFTNWQMSKNTFKNKTRFLVRNYNLTITSDGDDFTGCTYAKPNGTHHLFEGDGRKVTGGEGPGTIPVIPDTTIKIDGQDPNPDWIDLES